MNKILIIPNYQVEAICQNVISLANACQSDFQFYVLPQITDKNSPLNKKQLNAAEGIGYLHNLRAESSIYSQDDFILAFYNGSLNAIEHGLSNLFMAGSSYEENPPCIGLISLQYLNWNVLEEKYNYELQKHSILHLIICGLIGAYTNVQTHEHTYGCLLDFNGDLTSFNQKLQKGYYLCDENEAGCQQKMQKERYGNSIIRLCNSLKYPPYTKETPIMVNEVRPQQDFYRNLLANQGLENALNELYNNEGANNEITLYKTQFRDLKKQEYEGLISYENISREKARITSALINFIDENL